MIKNDQQKNIVILIFGIAVFPMGLWGMFIPTNILNRTGLQNLVFISFFWTFLASVAINFLNISRFKTNKKRISFWIGLILNYIYAILSVLIIVLVIIAAFSIAANGGV